MTKFIRWLFWNAAYLCYRPKAFEAYLESRMRCRWPWRKFKPVTYHNDYGGMWHVWLSDERCYTEPPRTLKVDLHIGFESGKVVGFDVWDEDLEAANPQPDAGEERS